MSIVLARPKGVALSCRVAVVLKGVICLDVDGYARRLSWVHDLTPRQLLEAYASEDGGLLHRWVNHEECRGADRYWEEWRKSALRLER